jgi:collagenase-like PrtC family protease
MPVSKEWCLARELNLDQVREIHEATDVELEFFVSGALCVSFQWQLLYEYRQW